MSVGAGTIRHAMHRLEELHRATGADGEAYNQKKRDDDEKERAIEERVARLSKYKQTEYYATQVIGRLRKTLREIEEAEGKLNQNGNFSDTLQNSGAERSALLGNSKKQRSPPECAQLRQTARRCMQQLQKYARDAQLYAMREGCHNDLKELQGHIDNAKVWYREQFRLSTDRDGDDFSGAAQSSANGEDMGNRNYNMNYFSSSVDGRKLASSSTGGSGGVMYGTAIETYGNEAAKYYSSGNGLGSTLLSGEDVGGTNTMQKGGGPVPYQSAGASLQDDQEFQLFFEQVRDNDQLMDQAFDRIAQGVTRIQENARMLTSELQVQDRLIDEVEVKVEKTTTELKGMNKKLKKAIKEVHKTNMCLYALCFIAILGIIGILVSFFK